MDIIRLMLLSRQMKNRRHEKDNMVTGIPPLTFTAKKTGTLKNYRIYGGTVNGESVGDLVTSGDHAGEYSVPVTINSNTTSIYLPYQIRKVGDEAEYIDYEEQMEHRLRKNLLQNTATSQTINGVTFTVNADGSVTCNGTANSIVILRVASKVSFSDNCKLSGSLVGGGSTSFLLRFTNNKQAGEIEQYNDFGNGVTFNTNMVGNIEIRIASGYTCENLTFHPMVRKASVTDDTYESYIQDTELDVTLPAMPTLSGTNTLSVGTEVQPSRVELTGRIKEGES